MNEPTTTPNPWPQDFPHSIIHTINETSGLKYKIFSLSDESSICNEFQDMLKEGASMDTAKQLTEKYVNLMRDTCLHAERAKKILKSAAETDSSVLGDVDLTDDDDADDDDNSEERCVHFR